jgi:putative FmdB family regulatory protein
MPIYEYECCCGHEFELLVRNADSKGICPVCGSEDNKRKFSVFGMKSASSPMSVSGGCSCGGCSGKSCSGCKH